MSNTYCLFDVNANSTLVPNAASRVTARVIINVYCIKKYVYWVVLS